MLLQCCNPANVIVEFKESCFCKILLFNYSQTFVQRPPSGLEKSGRLKEVPDKTEI
jgi:hypothetical protein